MLISLYKHFCKLSKSLFFKEWRLAVFFLFIFCLLIQCHIWCTHFAQAETNFWSFSNSANYVYNSTKLDFVQDYVQLKFLDLPTDWYDSDWDYRRSILINNTQNSSALTNYEIDIELNSSSFDFSKAQSNGGDIRFTDSNGTSLLGYLKQNYDFNTQTATFRVLVPNIPANSNKTIYIYYGNSLVDEYYDYFHLSASTTTLGDYGLSYPVTYEFSIPSDSSNLKAYIKYALSHDWTIIDEKISSDLFNGIEAARFDYSQNKAYLSVGFDNNSEDIFLKITDNSDQTVKADYLGISQYYDNRDAAVVVSTDDWSGWGISSAFTGYADLCVDSNIWLTGGIYETENFNSSTQTILQTVINNGYFEPASHSRSHPPTPYADYESEIGGSKEDILNLFDFPLLNKRGDDEFLYVWIEPGGYSDEDVRIKLAEHKYLISRSIAEDFDEYASWDSDNGLFHRTGVSIWADDKNICGWAGDFPGTESLNSKFDSVINEGGIYHLANHPQCVTVAQLTDHFDYIKEKTNLWYVGLGHLYLYHFVDDQEKVSVYKSSLGESDEWSSVDDPLFTIGSEANSFSYSNDNPTVIPGENQYLAFTSLSGFSESAVKNSGEIKYQLSNDAGTSWYWYDSSWIQTDAGFSEANTANEIDLNINSFPVGDGKLMFKAYLHSNGNQLVKLASIDIEYEYNNDSSSSSSTSSSSNASTCFDLKPGLKPASIYGAIAQSSQSILLFFTPADAPVSKYILEYGTSSGNYVYGVQDLGLNSKEQMSFLVEGLSSNSIYYFRIRGDNGCANGNWSNEIYAKTSGYKIDSKSNIKVLSLEPRDSNQFLNNDDCEVYIVKKDDSLWLIAEKELGNGQKYIDIIEQNKDRYHSLISSNNVEEGWELLLSCPTTKDSDLNISQVDNLSYQLFIKIVDPDNNPIAGAEISIDSQKNAVSDEDGIAIFNKIEKGNHQLTILNKSFKSEQMISLKGDTEVFELNLVVENLDSPKKLSKGFINIVSSFLNFIKYHFSFLSK